MRESVVTANWKMNMKYSDGIELLRSCLEKIRGEQLNGKVIFAPPFYLLRDAVRMTEDLPHIHIAAQNCHDAESGAFTGEMSAPMLRSAGVEYVIVGHSERRKYFNENDGWIARKIDSAIKSELSAIFCCGEELEARQSGQYKDVVEKQIRNSLFHLNGQEFGNIIIAYEPVWAIGTGHTANAEQAQEMHAFIRDLIAQLFTQQTADVTSILYGGSCKAENASGLFSQKDVDGGLIGGASLKPDEFVSIINQL